MPKYTSQINTDQSPEKVNELFASFLSAKGYKITDKYGYEWRKGFYWFLFVRYRYTQGIIDIEVWNHCPYPGMGSFLMYFIGINELKALQKDLEQLLLQRSSPMEELTSRSPLLSPNPQPGNSPVAINPSTFSGPTSSEVQHSAVSVVHPSTPVKNSRIPGWVWGLIILGIMGCLVITGTLGVLGAIRFLSNSPQTKPAANVTTYKTTTPPTSSTAPKVVITVTKTAKEPSQELQSQPTTQPAAQLPGTSLPIMVGAISPQNIKQVSEKAHTDETPQNGPLFCHQVAWSLDNERIAIASNNIHIFDFRTGQEEVTITGLQWVNSIVTSPDGKSIATSSDSGGVQLWDPIANTELLDFAKQAISFQKLAISGDGKILAATNYSDGGFTLYDVGTGKRLLSVSDENGPYSIAFSPDGKTLAGGGAQLKLWNVQDGHEIRIIKGYGSGIKSVAFSPDGKVLATSSFEKTITLWDAASGNEIKTLSGHTDYVSNIDFSPDGRLLASLSADNTIRFWDMSSGKELNVLPYHSGIPQDIRFSPDGTMIAACGMGAPLRVWGLPNSKANQPTATWAPPTPTVRPANAPLINKSSQLDMRLGAKQLLWPRANQLLIGGYGIQVYDPTHNSKSTIGDEQWITGMAISADKNNLAISEYEAIKLYTLSGAGGKTLGKSGNNSKLAFSPDGKTLAVSINQAVKIFDVSSGNELSTIPIEASWMQDIAFSPDGKSLVIVSAVDVTLWDIASGSQSKSFSEHIMSPKTIVISPDGKTLAVGGSDGSNVGKIVLWDIDSGQWLRTLSGHKNTINTMAFSPDGRWLVSGSSDLTLRLWDISSGLCFNTLTGHTTPINAVAFSPDGKKLVSGGDDVIIFWEITPTE